MKKIALLIGAGVGYVLGARAGRERYEQISEKANKVWGDPRVQQKVEEVRTQAPQVASKVSGSAKSTADKAKSKVGGHKADGSEGSDGAEGSTMNSTGTMGGGDQDSSFSSGYGPGGERLP